MTKLSEYARPVMRSVRSLHAHQTRRQIGEKARHGISPQRLSQDNFAARIDAMNGKDVLRQIQTDSNDLHDIPPSAQPTFEIPPRREGGVHTIAPVDARGFLMAPAMIGCGHVSGLEVRLCHMPRAGMEIRRPGADQKSEREAR